MSCRSDLQSSTPEEYLDGRVLADEAGLGDGSLAVEGDGGLATESRVDDRRNLLLLLQRLLVISANHQGNICQIPSFPTSVYVRNTSNTGQNGRKKKKRKGKSKREHVHMRRVVRHRIYTSGMLSLAKYKIYINARSERLWGNNAFLFNFDKSQEIRDYYGSPAEFRCYFRKTHSVFRLLHTRNAQNTQRRGGNRAFAKGKLFSIVDE